MQIQGQLIIIGATIDFLANMRHNKIERTNLNACLYELSDDVRKQVVRKSDIKIAVSSYLSIVNNHKFSKE